MNEVKLNTPLTTDEIDFRIQSVSPKGWATLLAYKDARVDMNRLDAVYGVEAWQKKYEIVNDNLFCSVGIWSEKMNQWIWKQDVGTESNTEKEKGQASDAFKRACFNLGIGRELYDYPVLLVQLKEDEYTVEGNKAKPTYNLKLKQWNWYSEFKDGKISLLTAKDEKGNMRFSWPERMKQQPVKPEIKKPELDENGLLWKQKMEECKTGEEFKKVYQEGFKVIDSNEILLGIKKKMIDSFIKQPA